ncbi:MAG: porin family protein [Fimbriimonadaceae bacterium]
MRIILVSLFALGITAAQAQLTIGAKLGLNYSIYGTKIDPEPEEKPESDSGLGFHLGGYLVYDFSDKLGFRPELLYSARRVSFKDETTSTQSIFGTTITTKTETDGSATASYLEVPLLLNYKASDALSFQVGPGIGLLMGYKSKYDSKTTTTTTTGGTTTTTTSESSGDTSSKEGLRGMELGLAVGGVFELESGLNFGLRYWRGLSTFNEQTEFGPATVKTHANVIQFSIGYSFIKG